MYNIPLPGLRTGGRLLPSASTGRIAVESEVEMASRHEHVGAPLQDRQAALELAFIAEYLASAGQDLGRCRRPSAIT